MVVDLIGCIINREMTTVGHLDHLLAKRTYHRSHDADNSQAKPTSNIFISFSKLTETIFDTVLTQNTHHSPKRQNLDKFQ